VTNETLIDDPLIKASAQIERAALDPGKRPVVRAFFDEATHTVSYVVHCPETRRAAILDSVLDYEAAAGRTDTRSADAIASYIENENITVDWLLETHVHADHLSAAPYFQETLGGRVGICREIVQVQRIFATVFNVGPDFACDGSEFDHLFADGDTFRIGNLEGVALYVPGHTPADMAFVIGDAAFVGDTLFMPDYGTARVDFPGGDARQLYRSIRRLLSLPGETRLFLCHDYKAPGRDVYAWETTVAAQKAGNIHVHDGVSEEAFVALRTARDATLPVPKLIVPAIQVNMRGGHLPPPEDNGVRYLKIPLNTL